MNGSSKLDRWCFQLMSINFFSGKMDQNVDKLSCTIQSLNQALSNMRMSFPLQVANYPIQVNFKISPKALFTICSVSKHLYKTKHRINIEITLITNIEIKIYCRLETINKVKYKHCEAEYLKTAQNGDKTVKIQGDS